jgi:hypothetical protein
MLEIGQWSNFGSKLLRYWISTADGCRTTRNTPMITRRTSISQDVEVFQAGNLDRGGTFARRRVGEHNHEEQCCRITQRQTV